MHTVTRPFALLAVFLAISICLPVFAAPTAIADTAHEPVPDTQAVSSSPSRNIKVTLVTLRTPDTTSSSASVINLTEAKNAVSSANKYWKNLSHNRLSVSLSKTITGFKTKARTSQNAGVIIETVERELKWKSSHNSVLLIFVPRSGLFVNGKEGYQGFGGHSGGTSGQILMPATTPSTASVLIHEMGHVFGMRHANSLQCRNGAQDSLIKNSRFANKSCSSKEYGDTTDIMGYVKWMPQYLNAVLFDLRDMGRGDEILDLGYPDGSKSYTLKPWSGKGARRAIKFRDPVSKEEYYVQLRLPVGYDKGNATGGSRGVQILKADIHSGGSLLIPPSTHPTTEYSTHNQAWSAGKTFTTAGGAKVKVNYINGSAAGVTIQGGTLYKLAPQFNAVAKKHGLGRAVGATVGYLKNDGAYQQYERGYVYYSPATGARVSKGPIRTLYKQRGLQDGALGYPTSDEFSGLKSGGSSQNYQGGRIVWSAKTGARVVSGSIGSAWIASGAQDGILGYPTSDAYSASKSGGFVQDFERGKIVWTSVTGATVIPLKPSPLPTLLSIIS